MERRRTLQITRGVRHEQHQEQNEQSESHSGDKGHWTLSGNQTLCDGGPKLERLALSDLSPLPVARSAGFFRLGPGTAMFADG
jgi:hypothetical protein